MKKIVIRILSLTLALLMLLCCLIACKNTEDPSGNDSESQNGDVVDGTESESSSDTSNLDENGYVKDDLPETYDFKGVDFNILNWQQNPDFINSSEATASVVNRLKYQGQQAVQERFNVNIKVQTETDGWAHKELFTQIIEASVALNAGAYDLVDSMSVTVGMCTANGYYSDLNSLGYLDFEKPWWPQHLVESAKIGEKLYYCAGDVNAESLIEDMLCMYVNLDMYDTYKIAELVGGRSIYEVVEDGDWTIENLKKMSIGSIGGEGDEYGITLSDGAVIDAFLYAGGFSLVKTQNGILSLNADLQSGRMVTWFEACQEILAKRYEDAAYDKEAFENGRALFDVNRVEKAKTTLVPKGTVNFSVLPFPKYDKEQDYYYTCMEIHSTLLAVPVDVKDPTMSAMVLEGLASAHHRGLKDVVYYDVFQNRYASSEDAEGVKMFDLLYESVTFDIGRVFTNWGGTFTFRENVRETNGNWTTTYQQYSEPWAKKINDNIYAKLG